jgi:hypothetical protein
MPKSAAEMGNGQLCVDHETTMQETITQRRTVSTIRNKRRNWKMRKLYGEETDGPVLATSDIERIRKLETELGLKEPSALQPKTAVAAVLDALTRRPNGGK